jgi:hypothetical protein
MKFFGAIAALACGDWIALGLRNQSREEETLVAAVGVAET